MKVFLSGKLLLAAAASGLFSAPAMASDITLDVLHPFTEFSRFLQPLAEKFEAENPGVKVEFRLPPTDYMDADLTLNRAVMAGNVPDVYYSGFTVLESMVGTISRSGAAVDINQFLEKEGAEWVAANYSPAILNLTKIDGAQYAIPFNASTPIIFYNADLVKAAGHDPLAMPTTWDGLVELAAKIEKVGADVDGMNFSVGSLPGDWLWQTSLMTMGSSVLNEAGDDIGFDTPEGLKTLQTIRSLAERANIDIATTPKPVEQQFFAGKLGFYFASPAGTANNLRSVGDRFELRTAPFPIAAEGAGLPTGGNGIAVTAQDPARQAAAWEYVKFMTGAYAQAYVAKATGYMPTNRLAGEELAEFYAENPAYKTAFDQMDKARIWATYPGGRNTEIWHSQRDVIYSVQTGAITPEAGLEEIVSATRALLD